MRRYVHNVSLPIIKLNNNISYFNHFHYEIEILYIIKGSFHVKSRQRDWRLEAGDIFFAFPFVEHEYENLGENLAIILIIAPDEIPDHSGEMLYNCPINPVINTNQLCPNFGDIMLRIEQMFNHSSCDRAVITGYISAVVGELISVMSFEPRTDSQRCGLEKVMKYCLEHYDDPDISLAKVSREIGLSSCHISHIMSRYIGVGFAPFINSLRIDKACKLLYETDKNIIDIALECGFGSQRSFNRVFLASTGQTPSMTRKKEMSEN